MTVWCRKCDTRNDFEGNWLKEDYTCAQCGTRGLWRTEDRPKHAWLLTEKDERFLKSIRVTQA